MNSLVEILNRYSESALQFAWPMLWQSSALIVALFVLDFALRKKVRAAIRYALWLIVLVKLILPPTIASPTNPRWWIHSSNPPPAKVETVPFTVTYGDSFAPPDFQMPLASIPVSPPPQLSRAALILIASGFVSLSLFAWLLFRWRRVAQQICKAEISRDFKSLLDEVRQSTGLHSKIRLKLTDDSMSPAVCGLFRPVILLPQSLARNLSREQLRAVLLHEAIHLRRGDVWINCAQALLQIIYWWHPLFWLANARIRRVREEAVDDAVMLTLRDDSEIYAPTLLEVAKFAFRRPLATLGLVGILESRSALRQRIERLMDFRAPRKAGLTIISILGILAFTAVAVPMGEAPKSNDNSFSSEANSSKEKTLTVKVNPEIFIRNLKAQAAKSVLSPTNDYTEVLLELLRAEDVDCGPPHDIVFNTKTGEITTENTPDKLEIFRQVILQLNRPDGQCELPLRNNFRRKSVLIEARIYQMRAADFTKIASDLQFYPTDSSGDSWWSASPDKFNELLKTLKSSGFNPVQRPRIETGSGMPAEFYMGNGTNSVDFECKPFAGEGFVDLRIRGTIIANAAFTNRFNVQASAETHGGIVIRSENFDGHAESNLMTVISLQIATNKVAQETNESKRLFITDDAAKKVEAGQLVQDGKIFYETGRFEDAESNLNAALKLDPDNQAAFYYLNLVKKALYSPPQTPKANRLDNPAHSNLLIADAAAENGDFWTETFKINHPTNDENLKKLLSDAGVKSPTKFFFYINDEILIVRGSAEQLALAQGVVLKLNGFSSKEIAAANNRLLKQAQLPANPEWDNRLEMRTFKLDKFTFAAMRYMPDLQTSNYSIMAKSFFSKLGVDFDAPGRQIAFNDKLGLLFVKATPSELDTVERAIEALNQVTPQVHIKARFIEVPKGDVDPNLFTNAVAGPGTGILSDAKFRDVLRKLENQSGVETLAEPEVVTTSGRQTQIRPTLIQECVTNFTLVETSGNSTVVPQIGKFEIGPTADFVPYVLADGYTIDLKAIVSQLEFLGYDKPPNEHISRFDTQIHLPKVLPGFRSRKAEAVVNLWDNQTLVLGNLKSIFVGFTNGVGVETDAESKFFADVEKKSPNANKELLVFITATIVDPAGNRVHSDDELNRELSSRLPAIPPQN